MRRFLLIICLLLVANLSFGQGIDHAQMQDKLNRANDLILDGNNKEAEAQFRQVVLLCRKQGEAFLLEEIDALNSLASMEESTPGIKVLLQEMKDRVASVVNPPNPELLLGYITTIETIIDKREGRLDEAIDKLLYAFERIYKSESGHSNSRIVGASILMLMGDILMESGLYQNSLDYYQIAEQQLGQPTTRAEAAFLGSILTGQGGAYRELIEYPKALQCVNLAKQVMEEIGATRSRNYVYVLVNLGSLQALMGERGEALKTLKKSVDLIPEPCNDKAECMLVYYANVLGAGLYSEAEAGLEELAQLADQLQLRPTWWVSYYQYEAAIYMSTGRIKKSIDATDRAIALVKSADIINLHLLSVLYNQLATNYLILGDNATSKAFSDLSKEVIQDAYGDEYVAKQAGRKKSNDNSVFDKTGRLMDECDKNLSEGRLEAALNNLDEALLICRENGVIGTMPLTLASLKLFVLEQTNDTKRLKSAINSYLDDLRADLRLNLSYMTEEEREMYYSTVIPSIRFARLTENDASLAEEVFNTVLLRKNFLLGAGIGLERLIMDSGDSALQSVLLEMKALRSGPAQNYQLSKDERYAATERADSLENILLRRSHDYGDFLSISNIRWQDVQRALGPDDVAVEFIQAGDDKVPDYCALVLRRGWKSPKNVILFSDEDGYIKDFTDSAYTEVLYDGPEMYGIFWEPLEVYMKPGDRVFFAMDGFLNAFAFEHFRTKNGACAADRYDLHRVSSTREVIGWNVHDTERSAALFGGFDFNLSGEEVSYYASTNRGDAANNEWGYLPGSLAEVKAADQILKNKMDVALYTGENGLESRFKALSGNAPDLLHVATHGYYVEGDDDPMARSGLVFSGANALREEGPAESGEDGLLKSSEIALLDLRGTDLIVLSACQSGIGSISSDGVYGLQRAFKKAGVHSILMSLWKVNDQVTAEMMRLFYTGLAAGKDSRSAFQAARETLRKTYPDPLLWAPFVLLES